MFKRLTHSFCLSRFAAIGVALFAIVVLVGCNAHQSGGTKTVVKLVTEFDTQGTPDVLATIDGAPIKDSDLRQQPDYRQEFYRAEVSRYEAEKQAHDTIVGAVDRYVADIVLKKEAEKLGMTTEDLLKKEVESKTAKPTEKEARAFYDEKKINRPFDTLKERIIDYLMQEKRREQNVKYMSQLKKKYNVEIKVGEFKQPKPLPPKVDIEVADNAAIKGPKDAPITIIEFSDYQCPYCKRAEATVDEVYNKYKEKVRVVYRHFPLDFHKNAFPAAVAAECAKEQGKFWEYHGVLFENQTALESADLLKYAGMIKLDEAKFKDCVEGNRYADAVNKDMEEGKKFGVTGTPAFFVNGRFLSGARPAGDFEELIEVELSKTSS